MYSLPVYASRQQGARGLIDVKQEDEDLATEQFPDLNRQFYASNPAAYFKSRLQLLIMSAGATDQVGHLLANGVEYEGIQAKATSGVSDEDTREHSAFVTTEAEVLLHHVAEALLRLFFAHADVPLCPWLECARLRNFALFNKHVADISSSGSASQREQIAQVFLGSVPEQDDTVGTEAVDTVQRLLKFLATRLLDDKNIYNAAKHGLAIVAGTASIAVDDDTGAPVFGHRGPSVTYLEVPTEERRWRLTTRWVNTRQAILLTSLTVMQLHSLWVVARYRYTGVEASGVEVITRDALDRVLTGDFANDGPVTRFSQQLAYYVSKPAADG